MQIQRIAQPPTSRHGSTCCEPPTSSGPHDNLVMQLILVGVVFKPELFLALANA